jgi:phage RecT family recombinase
MADSAIVRKDFWSAVESKCAKALPQQVDAGRFWQMVLSTRQDKHLRSLMETQQGEMSLARAFWGCAVLGLYPDPTLQHIAIVPFGQQATLIPMYQGLVELLYRTGFVKSVKAEPVFVNDDLDMNVATGEIQHRPHWLAAPGSKRGDLWCCYAIIENVRGGRNVTVMDAGEINSIRDNTASVRKGRSTPWTDSPESYVRMAAKTVLRRAIKLEPKIASPALSQATTWDEQAERGEQQAIPPLDDELPPETHEHISDDEAADIADLIDVEATPTDDATR